MINKWIDLNNKCPKDGQSVHVKYENGAIREAIYIDEKEPSLQLCGWMVESNFNEDVVKMGQITHWKVIK